MLAGWPCRLLARLRIAGGPPEPGDDTDRYIEYWNHVFMSYELHEDGSLTKLPANNVDTGLGLERMAAILQNVDSVFQADAFSPLVGLAEEMSGRSYEQDRATTRAMRSSPTTRAE